MRGVTTIACKELADHLRDHRALLSTGVYALMGPAVILLLQSSPAMTDLQRNAMMMSIFTLLSAFSGATAIAADMVAGERERHSLVPLLLSGVSPAQMVAGKWLAASCFALFSCVCTLLAFAGVSLYSSSMPAISLTALAATPNLVFLAALAAAAQVLISTSCRSVKEANSWLTILIFAAMGLSMWAAFAQAGKSALWSLMPVVGDQHLLQNALAGNAIAPAQAAGLGVIAVLQSAVMLASTVRLFRSDRIVFGT